MTDTPLTLSQVAALFGVSPQTVRDWANAGKLAHFRTPSGQRRFRRADVDAFLTATGREK
jgi:excisionase family DNA binding protein